MAWNPVSNIKGPQGNVGPAGAQGPQGTTGAQGPQGAKGDQGATGPAGTDGANGSTWYTAAGAPAGVTGVVGDFYLNSTNGDYYQKTTASLWTLRGNIKGPTGAQGAQGNTGNTGAQGPTGSQGPAGADGADGADGAGVPAGGATGTLLRKKSATNNDTEWSNRVKGTATNDNAAAGDVGECLSSIIPFASAVSQTTGVGKNLTSIVLTAGDWDVRGEALIWFNGLAASSYGTYTADISLTSATVAGDGTQFGGIVTSLFANLQVIVSAPLPARRISLAATTTVYLTVRPVFGAPAACSAYGYIEARRIR